MMDSLAHLERKVIEDRQDRKVCEVHKVKLVSAENLVRLDPVVCLVNLVHLDRKDQEDRKVFKAHLDLADLMDLLDLRETLARKEKSVHLDKKGDPDQWANLDLKVLWVLLAPRAQLENLVCLVCQELTVFLGITEKKDRLVTKVIMAHRDNLVLLDILVLVALKVTMVLPEKKVQMEKREKPDTLD